MSLGQETEQEKVAPRKRQKETPSSRFVDEQWEVVGENFENSNFALLDLPVIDQPEVELDDSSVFKPFDAAPKSKRSSVQHGGGQSEGEKEAERVAVEAQNKARHEDELRQKFEEGMAIGKAEAEKLVEVEVAKQSALFGEQARILFSEIKEQTTAILQRIEKESVALSVNIARKILETTVAVQPEYILDVIRKSIPAVGAATPLRIRVSPQDYEFLKIVGVPPELSESELGITYAADEAISSGCVVETNYGEVNLELDQMWESINSRLAEVYKS